MERLTHIRVKPLNSHTVCPEVSQITKASLPLTLSHTNSVGLVHDNALTPHPSPVIDQIGMRRLVPLGHQSILSVLPNAPL